MDKTFDAKRAEPRIYAAWEDAKAFRAGANASCEDTFSIMIPPPNVTGSLHMGHAFNNTLQDILVRWHRMRGHDTLWQPGTDHAGIATQMVVERELAKNGEPGRREMGRAPFVRRVWQQKESSEDNIKRQLQRLGASCDWDRMAFTMSGNFHDAVIKVFIDLYEKGLIYRGKRLVNWDPHFETAISDLEVENVEVDGCMWHFKYPLADGQTYEYVETDADGNVTLRETRDYISIATTRPETMLGDGAVAVHPSDARYAPIVGKLCEIPVGPKAHRRRIPIITDDYPDPDFGSGAVKITGAHDFNDYAVASRGGIPMYRLMDTAGRMRADGAPYAEAAALAAEIVGGREMTEGEIDTINLVPDDLRGLDRFEARDRVVAQITAEGLAVMTTAEDPSTSPPTLAIEGRRKRKELGVWEGPEGEFYVNESLDEAIAEAKLKYPQNEIRLAPIEGIEDGVFYTPSATQKPEKTILWLRSAHPLVEQKKIMQPFGDRSKVVIEPMLTDQWFVDAEKIVSPAIQAVRDGTVEILPEQDKKVYFHWLENIEPWCISRQLWWGHRIPVWYGPSKRMVAGTETLSFDPAHLEKFVGASEDEVRAKAAAFYDLPGPEHVFIVRTFDHAGAGSGKDMMLEAAEAVERHDFDAETTVPIYQDPDVLDTWFSSGLWPIGTLGWPEQTPELARYFPTSVLITGFDIIFFWVARMMMMQYAVVGRHPFDTVYVHALVRDAKGKKMSKSLGNVLDPLDLVDEYGADAVRFTLASMAAMGRDLKLSTARIAGYRNFATKLWNAFRFAEMNGVFAPDATPVRELRQSDATQAANRWIVGETARVREEVDAALEAFKFNDAANGLYAFVWGRVCDWYIEFAKPLFASADPEVIAETRATMAWVLDQCLILLHPFMPFVTEELWGQTATRAKMLVHADWPGFAAADLADEVADREMTWVIGLIEAVRSVRGEMNVPAAAVVPLLALDMDAEAKAAWDRNSVLIQRLARIESLTPAAAAPRGSATVAVSGATLALPLAELIDVAAERARLEKTLERLAKDLKGLEGRLRNPRFIESAPDDIVEETRERAAEKTAEAERLEAALARLREVA